MVSLFTESPFRLVVVVALIEVVLAILLVATRRGKYVFIIAIVAVGGLALLGLERLIVTPRERIDGVLLDVTRAVERGDIESVREWLSPQCRFRQMDRDGILSMAASVLREIDIERVSLAQKKLEVFRIRRQARVQFLALADGTAPGIPFHRYPTSWVLFFDESPDGRWVISRIEQLEASDLANPAALPRP